MDTHPISIGSWNVGLMGNSRKYVVKTWLSTVKPLPKILGIQEIRASPFLTDVALNLILPDYNCVVSLPNDGRGGSTLLFHPSYTLLSSGTISFGRAAWAQLQIAEVIILVISIYALS